MTVKISLSPEERNVLQQILLIQSQRAKHPITLHQLINDWARFVVTVERGYEDSIYEYANDLSTRDLIQAILDKAPSRLRGKLLAWIEPWDRRFFASTKPVDKSVRSSGEGDAAPWHARVPIHLGVELEEDFRSEGIL